MNFNKARFYYSIRKGAKVNFLVEFFEMLFLASCVIPFLTDYRRLLARTDTSDTIVENAISRIRLLKISHFRKANLSCFGRIEELISLNELMERIYIYIYI